MSTKLRVDCQFKLGKIFAFSEDYTIYIIYSMSVMWRLCALLFWLSITKCFLPDKRIKTENFVKTKVSSEMDKINRVFNVSFNIHNNNMFYVIVMWN